MISRPRRPRMRDGAYKSSLPVVVDQPSPVGLPLQRHAPPAVRAAFRLRLGLREGAVNGGGGRTLLAGGLAAKHGERRPGRGRSEERRGGKEGRSRWGP